jgi:hypothetical protein
MLYFVILQHCNSKGLAFSANAYYFCQKFTCTAMIQDLDELLLFGVSLGPFRVLSAGVTACSLASLYD